MVYPFASFRPYCLAVFSRLRYLYLKSNNIIIFRLHRLALYPLPDPGSSEEWAPRGHIGWKNCSAGSYWLERSLLDGRLWRGRFLLAGEMICGLFQLAEQNVTSFKLPHKHGIQFPNKNCIESSRTCLLIFLFVLNCFSSSPHKFKFFLSPSLLFFHFSFFLPPFHSFLFLLSWWIWVNGLCLSARM